MSDAGNALPELRASDAEREQTAEILRRAAAEGRLNVEELEDRLSSAYVAATRSELMRLIADVSPERLGAAPTPGRSEGLTVKDGPGGSSWVVSILGGHSKRGRWRLAPRCTVVNVLGGSEIDLNDAELSEPVTDIHVYSVLGGCQFWIPHGVEVQVSNLSLLGGNDVQLGDEVAPRGAPVIRLRLVSILGGSEIMRGRKLTRAERKRERELRTADRGELEP